MFKEVIGKFRYPHIGLIETNDQMRPSLCKDHSDIEINLVNSRFRVEIKLHCINI